jgi:hypothetical protein
MRAWHMGEAYAEAAAVSTGRRIPRSAEAWLLRAEVQMQGVRGSGIWIGTARSAEEGQMKWYV